MPTRSGFFEVQAKSSRIVGGPWLLASLLGLGACGGQPETAGLTFEDPEVSPVVAAAEPSGAAPTEGTVPRGCVAPKGVSGSPGTLSEVLTLINALPHPVTIPCFLESLERPLQVNATSSVFSAQPAVGNRSPRVFIFSGQMVLSVVPDGLGRNFLESSQLTSATRSVKSEIEFPVDKPLGMADAFSRIPFNGASICGLCHAEERRVSVDGTPGGFESKALKPRADTVVSVESMRKESLICDAAKEPERCAILTALMAHGAVHERAFPTQMETFF
ncbi:MAG: hypothetical protein SFV15_23300 [Polyangiaceae bacterium]|nr:hypothetical protein [Polyangiaceae bacterium]